MPEHHKTISIIHKTNSVHNLSYLSVYHHKLLGPILELEKSLPFLFYKSKGAISDGARDEESGQLSALLADRILSAIAEKLQHPPALF